ncbi:MAG: LysR family transcriptional regulator [Deltaproteobacteria bacterium]|nr:LysR family transcriptional regulator [Nannocystaceae bacterium]
MVLTCCDSYVSQVLIRELVPFFARCPDIELAITIDARIFDLSRREADIAVRALVTGAQPPEHLLGAVVAPLMLANYVAIAHADRLDPERSGTSARWISFDDRRIHEAMIAASSYANLPAWGSFSSLEVMVQATREGLGLSMLPTYVGDREPHLRRLARPDLRHVANLWLLSHPDLRDNARFRAMRAAISAVFASQTALFRGDG